MATSNVTPAATATANQKVSVSKPYFDFKNWRIARGKDALKAEVEILPLKGANAGEKLVALLEFFGNDDAKTSAVLDAAFLRGQKMNAKKTLELGADQYPLSFFSDFIKSFTPQFAAETDKKKKIKLAMEWLGSVEPLKNAFKVWADTRLSLGQLGEEDEDEDEDAATE